MNKKTKSGKTLEEERKLILDHLAWKKKISGVQKDIIRNKNYREF